MEIVIRTFTIFFLIIGLANTGAAMDVYAGRDRTECPGTEITLGGDASTPTAGPGPLDNYKFEWIASTGEFVGSTPNPVVKVKNVTTVYTVYVTDLAGFKCEASVTITPITLSSLEFTPPYLPSDGKSTSQGKVVILPEERPLIWTIIDADGSNSTLNSSTGLLTAGTNPGTVKVRAQDKAAAEQNIEQCFVEGQICVGDRENCCGEIKGGVTLGKIQVSILENFPMLGGSSDPDGYCSYSTSQASINLQLLSDIFPNVPTFGNIPNVTVSFKKKSEAGKDLYKEITLNWKGVTATQKVGPLDASITEIDLSLNSDFIISGLVVLSLNQNTDVSLAPGVVLEAGASGTFTFRYSGSSSGFEGEFDFGGIDNLRIGFYKKSTKIAEASGKLTSEGVFSGELKGLKEVTFSSSNFKAELKDLNWGLSWNLKTNSVDFLDGKAKIELSEIKSTAGTVSIDVSMNGKSVTGEAELSPDFVAYGCALTGQLSLTIDYQFNIESLVGSNISSKHPEFQETFLIRSFVIQNNEIKEFDFAADVRYKGVRFRITKVHATPEKALLSATLLVKNSGMLMVEDFALYGVSGLASIGTITLIIEEYPFVLKGSISIKDNQFKGSYSGHVKGGIGVSGTVYLGSVENFNFLYFDLGMTARKGVPVGPVLFVNELQGKVGYNYSVIQEQPVNGTYLFGFVLGLTDVTEIIQFRGGLDLEIGVESALRFVTDISIPGRRKAKYLEGKLQATYFFGTNAVAGSTSAKLMVPANTGSVLNLGGTSAFDLSAQGWKLQGDGDGLLFNKVSIKSSYNINAPASSTEDFTGRANCTISSSHSFKFTKPEGFDATSCESADQSDFFGFGADGVLNLQLSGFFESAISKRGFEKDIKVEASGSSVMKVKWPCITGVCTNCLKSANVNFSGVLEVKTERDDTVISGELDFKGNDGESKGVDVSLKF